MKTRSFVLIILIFVFIVSIMLSLFIGTFIKIKQKAEESKEAYDTWKQSQFEQLTDDELSAIDLTIEELLKGEEKQ